MSCRSEGKISLRRSGRRREDNIKVHYEGIRWEGVRWIWFGSEQSQVEGSCKRGTETSGSIKTGGILTG